MSGSSATANADSRDAWGQVSWPLATLVAPLAPVLVFWTWVFLNVPLPQRPALLVAIGTWLVIAIALAYFPTRGARTWGLGLLAGVAACLPWAAIPGLIA